MGQLPEDAIGIEVDAALEELDDHVAPSTLVDPVATLRLTMAYLDLLQTIADEREHVLVLYGLEVVDKCTAVFARASDPVVARQCMTEALSYLGSSVRLPRGIQVKVEAVRDAREKLPPQYKAAAFVGNSMRRDIDVAVYGQGFPAATLRVRAVPIRVGGRTPTAIFESASEKRRFTLKIGLDQAKRLAPHIYTEVDIEALVLRADDGLIESGELRDFFPLEDGDPWEAWSKFVHAGLRKAH